MTYLVNCIYKPDQEQIRAKLQRQHVEHFVRHLDKVLYGASLRGDDGKTSVGTMFVLNCETREDVATFLRGDPLHQHRVFATVTVHRAVVMIPEQKPGALLNSIGGGSRS